VNYQPLAFVGSSFSVNTYILWTGKRFWSSLCLSTVHRVPKKSTLFLNNNFGTCIDAIMRRIIWHEWLWSCSPHLKNCYRTTLWNSLDRAHSRDPSFVVPSEIQMKIWKQPVVVSYNKLNFWQANSQELSSLSIFRGHICSHPNLYCCWLINCIIHHARSAVFRPILTISSGNSSSSQITRL